MKQQVIKIITDFIRNYSSKKTTLTRWQEPEIAFASADDPLFLKLKDAVSPTHALPQDLLVDAKTVIAFFIPFDESVVKSNIDGLMSSREWAVAYVETNKLIADLNIHLKQYLEQSGYQSTIIPATHNFKGETLLSDWSHRHVAYIAGLGTFGLNNMLITNKGCCGRIGSFVTNLKIEPTLKTDKEYCLYKFNGSCKKCISRCFNEALTTENFDRFKCYENLLQNDQIFSDLDTTDVCGKCLVGLPCSFKVPVNIKLSP